MVSSFVTTNVGVLIAAYPERNKYLSSAKSEIYLSYPSYSTVQYSGRAVFNTASENAKSYS